MTQIVPDPDPATFVDAGQIMDACARQGIPLHLADGLVVMPVDMSGVQGYMAP